MPCHEHKIGTPSVRLVTVNSAYPFSLRSQAGDPSRSRPDNPFLPREYTLYYFWHSFVKMNSSLPLPPSPSFVTSSPYPLSLPSLEEETSWVNRHQGQHSAIRMRRRLGPACKVLTAAREDRSSATKSNLARRGPRRPGTQRGDPLVCGGTRGQGAFEAGGRQRWWGKSILDGEKAQFTTWRRIGTVCLGKSQSPHALQ